MSDKQSKSFQFPKWVNAIRPQIALGALVGPVYLIVLIYYAASPQTTMVGYQPVQPVPYSHALHAGTLGIDCQYCHYTVTEAAHAAIPPTEVCMNCHATIWTESPKLLKIRESYATGMPVPWVRVHDLPAFVQFNHSAHVTRGVGCESCHGRVDKMEVVFQDKKLSMAWCIECHRAPEVNLRPPEFATAMGWAPGEDPKVFGARFAAENNLNPREDCSTCHY